MCDCLSDAEQCGQCGTWTRMGESKNGDRIRFHLLGHQLNGWAVTSLFQSHTPDRCRSLRDMKLKNLHPFVV
jgi:hypothetical protein